MRRKALLSIMTLYHHDNTIFDLLEIPTEPTEIEGVNYLSIFTPDKSVLVAGILRECAELESLFTNPTTVKQMLQYWSRQNLNRWQRVLNTMLYEYNPIWNVDGDVTTTRTGSRTTSGSGDRTETETESSTRDIDRSDSETTGGTSGNTRTETGSKVTTREVSAFDAAGFQNADKSTETPNLTTTDAGTTSGTGTFTGHTDDDLERTVSRTGEETSTGSETTSDTERIRRTGNIGVTMTQQMIEAERNLALFDFYGMIINEFKKEFCLMVY